MNRIIQIDINDTDYILDKLMSEMFNDSEYFNDQSFPNYLLTGEYGLRYLGRAGNFVEYEITCPMKWMLTKLKYGI